ncbi:MAG: DMT family transporter [Alphaproteobacteria bacterium]
MSLSLESQGSNNLGGIRLMALAICMFSMLDAQAKWLSQYLPAIEIAWCRYTGHFLLMTALFWPRRRTRLLHTTHLKLQLIRSVLLVCCTLLFFTAISYLPLADAIAISFSAPLLLTALSVPLLKEQVGWRRWTAVGIGFVGMLVIVRPGLGVMHWAAGLLLVMSLFYALFQIITRMISDSEDGIVTLYYSALVGVVILTVAVPFVWVNPPGLMEAAMMCGLGFFGGLGHYFLIQAYRLAPAGLLAPMSYGSLLTGTFFGYLIWGDFPDGWTISGAAILIATGAYIIYREAVRRRETQTAE